MSNIEKLFEILTYSSKMLGYEDLDDDTRIEFLDEVLEYEDSLHKLYFTFTDLINAYWANLLDGGYWEIAGEYDSEEDFFRDTYKRHPEHRFGFWRNAKSKVYKDSIYFSTESWIIPDETNLIQALKNYSEPYAKFEINEAELVNFNGKQILLTNNIAVYFDQNKQLQNAINCSQKVLNGKLFNSVIIKENINEQNNLFAEHKKVNTRKKKRYIIDPALLSFKVSELGDLVLASYKGFNHIFFGNTSLPFEDIKELNAHLYPAFSKTQNLIEKSISNNCNWQELNDDTFEELCYDLLYCHSKFDSSTIKKMGKSKSRDGGRDIVIKSKKTPTAEPELYIFQCKFLSESTSLSAAKMGSAANVIMQYGAKGYGVFTTTVIDATLYDMLEGFKRNQGIDVSDTWSKYELARYLNRHSIIKNKYFKQEH